MPFRYFLQSFFFALGLLVFGSISIRANAEEWGKILRNVDAYRSVDSKNFFILIDLTTKNGRDRRLEVYTDGIRSLAKFLKPAKEKGRVMFKADQKSLWLFIPGNKRLVRISQTQRLLGQVSIGDVLSINFSADYKPVEKKTDAENKHWIVLKLKGRTKYAQYKSIDLWVDDRSHQAVKSKHYAISGKLLKTVFYEQYQKIDGTVRLAKVRVKDDIKRNDDTFIHYISYRAVEIPDNFYNKNNLENL